MGTGLQEPLRGATRLPLPDPIACTSSCPRSRQKESQLSVLFVVDLTFSLPYRNLYRVTRRHKKVLYDGIIGKQNQTILSRGGTRMTAMVNITEM